LGHSTGTSRRASIFRRQRLLRICISLVRSLLSLLFLVHLLSLNVLRILSMFMLLTSVLESLSVFFVVQKMVFWSSTKVASALVLRV
jgi:hypothetical protein